MSIHNFSLTA